MQGEGLYTQQKAEEESWTGPTEEQVSQLQDMVLDQQAIGEILEARIKELEAEVKQELEEREQEAEAARLFSAWRCVCLLRFHKRRSLY